MTEQAAPFVRREVWSLAADDPIITAYARAVELMKGRHASDPTSWSYQAAMHGTEDQSASPLWNGCQHGGWFFLPWHRMFLYHFEEIVRAAVIATGGPADWALPYWNYGLGGKKAELPEAFRNPADASNPLYVGERAPGINEGAAVPAIVASPRKALARPNFVGSAEFGGNVTRSGQFWRMTGQLEQTPHNDIHGAVGGEGLMGNVRAAAQDPIFWLHHANIDRLWSVWAAQPGRTAPTESQWQDQSFEFFDKDGKRISMKCSEVLETASDLGYVYDTDAATDATPAKPPQPAVAQAMTTLEPQMVGASEQGIALVGATASIPVKIDGKAARDAQAPNQRVYLNVEDIEGETNPGNAYGIFVNLPEGAPADLASPHHVGNLSFFGIEHARNPDGDEHGHGLRVAVEITGLADELKARGDWEDHELLVTFRPVAGAAEHKQIKIGRVSVFYDA